MAERVAAHHSPRSHAIAGEALSCLQVGRDMDNEAMVEICQRVIAALRRGEQPRLGDVRAISLAMRGYFPARDGDPS